MRRIANLLALLSPAPALALSCMPYGPMLALVDAKADGPTAMVVGTLEFDEAQLPVVNYDQQAATPPLTTIAASLVGHIALKDGKVGPITMPVTLEVACIGPWCGMVLPETEYMTVIRQTEDGPVIRISPCETAIFQNVEAEMMDRLQTCMSGGACNALPN
ncbi:MAG: hypothetical protein AAFU82_03035 [Pseudomonadota bacterium]